MHINRLHEQQGATPVKRLSHLKQGKALRPISILKGILRHTYVALNMLTKLAREYQIRYSERINSIMAACKLVTCVLDYVGTSLPSNIHSFISNQ